MTEASHTILKAGRADLADIREFVKRASLDFGGAEDPVAELVLAVNEATTNIVTYGYGSGAGYIDISVAAVGRDIVVTLIDQSPAFDPNRIPTPDIAVPLELRRPGGLGIHLMRSFTDEMVYERKSGLNVLTLRKRDAIAGEDAEDVA